MPPFARDTDGAPLASAPAFGPNSRRKVPKPLSFIDAAELYVNRAEQGGQNSVLPFLPHEQAARCEPVKNIKPELWV
jgi:hypothetical protein